MKTIKLLSLSAVLAVVGVAAFALQENGNAVAFEVNATQFAYDADEVTTRRIYFVNDWDSWYSDNTTYWVYAATSDWTVNSGLVASTTIYENFDGHNGGLYYADVSFAGASGSINVQIVSQSTWENAGKTNTAVLPALSSKSADVIWINNAYSGAGWNPGVGYAACDSTAKMKCIFDHINTCEKDYASGFYAYPQLNSSFLSVSTLDYTGVTIDDYNYEQYVDNQKSISGLSKNTEYNLSDKINHIKYMFDNFGWYVA